MFERLLDKGIRPSADEMALYCGENGERFKVLNSYLSKEFCTSQEIRFPYGNKYGWCVSHRIGKKLICDIFAEADAFTVMMRLSGRQYEAIYADLSSYTQKHIDSRYPCGDGGWIHYRVTCEQHIIDIKKLLSLKFS